MLTSDPISRTLSNNWTGRWRWNAKTAVFSNPHHVHAWKEQYQSIVTKDEQLLMRCHQLFPDGSRRSWTYDGAFDGKPRPITWDDDGSPMVTIAFIMLTDSMGGDVFQSINGEFQGAEYYVLSNDKCSVWGCSTTGGQQFPYFEEWDRIRDDDAKALAAFRAVAGPNV